MQTVETAVAAPAMVRIVNSRNHAIVEEIKGLSEDVAYRRARQIANQYRDEYGDPGTGYGAFDDYLIQVLVHDASGLLNWRGQHTLTNGFLEAAGCCMHY